MKHSKWLPGSMFLLSCAGMALGQGQPDPSSPRMKGVMTLQSFFQTKGPEALQRSLEENPRPRFVLHCGRLRASSFQRLGAG